MQQPSELNVFAIVMGLVGGLVLFLFGVSILSDGLKAVAGERMKSILAKMTTNRFAAVATGTVATTVLDSSSAVTIMVVSLINAGLLTFVQAIGVIMGANIGTTVSSQLFAFDIDQYAPIGLIVGFLLREFGRTERQTNIGSIVLGFGLVFFGLGHIGEAMKPLRDSPFFIEMMTRMENPLMGAAVGALFTAVIQSSSATLGIIITLAGQGMINLPTGISLMLGADIGTCADTLVATIGRSRDAVRAGVFQLFFNVTSVALWIGFTGYLAQLAAWLSPNAVPRQIANAHVIFNVTSVLALIGFTTQIARRMKWLIPDKAGAEEHQEAAQQESPP